MNDEVRSFHAPTNLPILLAGTKMSVCGKRVNEAGAPFFWCVCTSWLFLRIQNLVGATSQTRKLELEQLSAIGEGNGLRATLHSNLAETVLNVIACGEKTDSSATSNAFG